MIVGVSLKIYPPTQGIMMKTFISIILIFLPIQVFSAPIWTSAKIDRVFAGYPDNSVVFTPIGSTVNPANCSSPTAYAVQSNHDAKGALSIMLAAKMADRTVSFSVRDDVCHTIQQTDVTGTTVPVIQRISIQ
ncbi:MAG: hypothetical protein ABW185_29205 [Sedimenticola sp.]